MFRITEDPSSGSLVQGLAKNYKNYSFVSDRIIIIKCLTHCNFELVTSIINPMCEHDLSVSPHSFSRKNVKFLSYSLLYVCMDNHVPCHVSVRRRNGNSLYPELAGHQTADCRNRLLCSYDSAVAMRGVREPEKCLLNTTLNIFEHKMMQVLVYLLHSIWIYLKRTTFKRIRNLNHGRPLKVSDVWFTVHRNSVSIRKTN